MTEPSRGKRPDPSTAGFFLVAAIVLCGGVGLGLGALLGAPVPFLLAGVFAGLALGLGLVYSRFRDI